MIAGIDEAGKGPVIGPLVICGVLCDEETVEYLKSVGVKDSKKLDRRKREELYNIIKSLCKVKVLKISVEDLNRLMEYMSINEILKRAYVEIIRSLMPKVVYIDCPDINVERFKHEIEERTGVEVFASHKADEIYPIVSIASIVAKVERDFEIDKLKKIYGDFGSGYPSDLRTIEFLRSYLREHKSFPPIVRKRWKTLKRLTTHTLSDFFEV
ncbi:ribonuclease HII [Archaeoglobus profundus DSM 5631]|uniref:Ribonuclease HII n=2 Tax=Archaeoglobus profundus TaxID=84156 RepID=D2RFM0_ARCPA|nr:ribonuclease HII [Archaeoglobus profundus DSM 5631]